MALPHHALAAIQLVGTTTATGNSAAFNASLTALSGGIASIAATNDLVVVIDAFTTGNGGANGNPGVGTAGYTELNDLFISDSNTTNFSVSYKFMGAVPDTSVSCNGSGSATLGTACIVYVWRGVDTGTPMDVASTSATSASSATLNCPSITPASSGAIVMCTGAMASGAVPTGVTWPTTPAGIGQGTTAQVDPSLAISAFVDYGAWTSSAYDPAAFTISAGTASQDSWAALTLALRPSTAPVVPTVTTTGADSFAAGAARLFGTISDTGGASIADSGFAVSTSSSLSTNVSTTSLGTQSGAVSFNTSTTTLSANTTYYYRSYATNSVGTGYGTIKSVTASGNTPARKMRLFEGFKIRVISGRVKLFSSALNCASGFSDIGGRCREFLTTTGSGTFTVPSNWNSGSNTIEVIGAGAGGVGPSADGGGGGGGGYAKITNATVSGSIGYSIGTGGAQNTAGADTWLCNSSASCSTSGGATVIVAAGGGGVGSGSTAGIGGAALVGSGFAGGTGGSGNSPGSSTGGGGGAAGPNGAGGSGSLTTGGTGDNGIGGAGGAACTAGSNGTEWSSSPAYGSGGGGGGLNQVCGGSSGSGGTYGGGGAGDASGAGTLATGQPGIIVITYTPL